MSWLVGEYIRSLPYITERGDINSDDFNNAIMIEKCIKDMAKKGLLSEMELNIVSLVYSGYNYEEIGNLLHANRATISKSFKEVTDRIAYILGGEFTDASLLERIPNVEDLSDHSVSDLFKRGIIKAQHD